MPRKRYSPPSIFSVLVQDATTVPALTGLCAGYEDGAWRCDRLAEAMFEWMPEFCLSYTELKSLSPESLVRLVKRAARVIYETKKFRKRGEFGELLLHLVLREVFNTVPAISKIYFKDGPNETVKGFDAVHVVPTKRGLELWLGEVKFYENASRAISDVVKEIRLHTRKNYLRREFVAIQSKVPGNWPYAARLKKLVDENTTLDRVFSALTIPVLVTYDSKTIASFDEHSAAYKAAIEAEWRKHHGTMRRKKLGPRLQVHVVFVPLNTKKRLLAALERRLRTWQQL